MIVYVCVIVCVCTMHDCDSNIPYQSYTWYTLSPVSNHPCLVEFSFSSPLKTVEIIVVIVNTIQGNVVHISCVLLCGTYSISCVLLCGVPCI